MDTASGAPIDDQGAKATLLSVCLVIIYRALGRKFSAFVVNVLTQALAEGESGEPLHTLQAYPQIERTGMLDEVRALLMLVLPIAEQRKLLESPDLLPGAAVLQVLIGFKIFQSRDAWKRLADAAKELNRAVNVTCSPRKYAYRNFPALLAAFEQLTEVSGGVLLEEDAAPSVLRDALEELKVRLAPFLDGNSGRINMTISEKQPVQAKLVFDRITVGLSMRDVVYEYVDDVLAVIAENSADVLAEYDPSDSGANKLLYVWNGEERSVIRRGAIVPRLHHPKCTTLPPRVCILSRVLDHGTQAHLTESKDTWHLLWMLHAMTRLDYWQTSETRLRLAIAAQELADALHAALHMPPSLQFDLDGGIQAVCSFVEALSENMPTDAGREKCAAFLREIVDPIKTDYRAAMRSLYVFRASA